MYAQYIYSVIMHTINNKHLYKPNKEIHKYETRNMNDLHRPITNSKRYIDGPYYSAIKIFNHLPSNIRVLENNPKRFKKTLKEFLCQQPFYSIQEYFNFKEELN